MINVSMYHHVAFLFPDSDHLKNQGIKHIDTENHSNDISNVHIIQGLFNAYDEVDTGGSDRFGNMRDEELSEDYQIYTYDSQTLSL